MVKKKHQPDTKGLEQEEARCRELFDFCYKDEVQGHEYQIKLPFTREVAGTSKMFVDSIVVSPKGTRVYEASDHSTSLLENISKLFKIKWMTLYGWEFIKKSGEHRMKYIGFLNHQFSKATDKKGFLKVAKDYLLIDPKNYGANLSKTGYAKLRLGLRVGNPDILFDETSKWYFDKKKALKINVVSVQQQQGTGNSISIITQQPIASRNKGYIPQTFVDLFKEDYRDHVDKFVVILRDIPDPPINVKGEWIGRKWKASVYYDTLLDEGVIHGATRTQVGQLFASKFPGLGKSFITNMSKIPSDLKGEYKTDISLLVRNTKNELESPTQ